LQRYAPHDWLEPATHLPAPLHVGAGVDEYGPEPEHMALPHVPLG
jgi:hypothetical protein